MITYRSWDVVKYLPVDIVNWGFVGQVIGQCLGIEVVRIVGHTSSAHVFLDDEKHIDTMRGEGEFNIVKFATPSLMNYRARIADALGMMQDTDPLLVG